MPTYKFQVSDHEAELREDIAMRLLGLLFGVLVMTVGAGSSWADGSIKDAPAAAADVCGSGLFNGRYMGAQVGYLDHDAKYHDELDTGHVDGDDSSVTFGVYSGINVQCGRLVHSLESDTNWADTDPNNFDDCCDQNVSSEMKYFSTLRYRLGLVHNENLMFYATAGLALAKLENSFAVTVGGNSFSASDDDYKFGWTAGGGVEFMRDSKWSFKAEVLYVDLGKEEIAYTGGICGVSCQARIGYENDFVVARIGLAYHFGAREEVAPLK
jgi:outer membrane immunogenic protein